MFTLFSLSASAQDWSAGVHVSPSYKVNMIYSKATTNRTFPGGYGFGVGFTAKKWGSDYHYYQTGLQYDFAAFDDFANGLLISSFRISSINIPLTYNSLIGSFKSEGNYFWSAGGGLGYVIAGRDLNVFATGTNGTPNMNRFQPYLSLGAMKSVVQGERGWEVGILIRYQIIDIWKASFAPMENFNVRQISFDIPIRYYF